MSKENTYSFTISYKLRGVKHTATLDGFRNENTALQSALRTISDEMADVVAICEDGTITIEIIGPDNWIECYKLEFS